MSFQHDEHLDGAASRFFEGFAGNFVDRRNVADSPVELKLGDARECQ
jgi:hypothetical protein